MSAAHPSQELRSDFEAALRERNFGERCHKLAAVGKELRAAALAPPALEATLDALADASTFKDVAAPPPAAPRAAASGVGAVIRGLAPKADGSVDVWGRVVAEEATCWRMEGGRIAKKETQGTKWTWAPAEADGAEAADQEDGDTSAFVERSRLVVAKAAGCAAYAKKLLSHPSKTVRFEAARGGLLTAEDAREAFLSPSTSCSLKRILIGCKSLPCDKEVLEQAWQLFGSDVQGGEDQDLVWEVLARATDEGLLRSWLLESGARMMCWLEDNEMNPAHLPQVAMRFPALMVDLARKEILRWSWHWAKDVLRAQPTLVLRAILLEGYDHGSGPLRGYRPDRPRQPIVDTAASWGWRHAPDTMLEICSGRSAVSDRLAELLMQVSSTRHYITTSQKIAYLSKIWSQLPTSEKTPELALRFVTKLPLSLKEHRAAELQKLVETFWKIVAEVGRAGRRELLVGAEAKPQCTEALQEFARRLPAPLAVEQFLRILDEFDAASPAYKFIQSDICTTKDGRHDMLALKVFERYLRKDGLTGKEAAEMFQVLLKDARSRDVVQKAFGTLMQRLGNKMDLGLLQRTLVKMCELERDSKLEETARSTPAATLPVPVHWARLVKLPSGASTHAEFLLRVLHSGAAEGELLGAMLKRDGPVFFWDCLGEVLKAAANLKPRALLEPTTFVDVQLLSKVDLTNLGKPLPQGTADGSIESQEAVVSVYFTALEETKRKTLGKDPNARAQGYNELMALAHKDVDQVKAFADLMPFLVHRFNAEQELGRASILTELLVKKQLPITMWEDNLAHLQALWKICAKVRESPEAAAIWRAWSKAGEFILEKVLCDWGDSTEPTAMCQFGFEVIGDQDSAISCLLKVFKRLFKERNQLGAQGAGAVAWPARTHGAAGEEKKPLTEAAVKWVFLTSVPLVGDGPPPMEQFWTVLSALASSLLENCREQGAERALWERWPFVAERWRAILAEGSSQKAVEFAFVTIQRKFNQLGHGQFQQNVQYKVNDKGERDESGKKKKPWWTPLECDEYKAIVSSILRQMETGEIPAKEASGLLQRRVLELVRKQETTSVVEGNHGKSWKVWSRRRRPRVEFAEENGLCLKAQDWIRNEKWDIPKNHCYCPLPFELYRCRDSVAEAEIAVLSKLLAARKAHRHVLWQIADVAACLAGARITKLLEDAIGSLDARFEGMARVVGRHYPYLNAPLAREEKQNGVCDVLTPLVELLLFDDETRDACVGRIMERPDFHLFLSFGANFARHLSNRRQEWLHRCLERLSVPGSGSEPEFYMYHCRGLDLALVAQLGPGWRQAMEEWSPSVADPGASGKGAGKGRGRGRGRGRRPEPERSEDDIGLKAVQMYLWHPETQAAFVEKALFETDRISLELAQRAAFAPSLAHARAKLERHPREQTVKLAGRDPWGWEVVQAAGAYSDISQEVERRFLEQPAPWVRDAMGDPEMETQLRALGRHDLAGSALRILGGFTSAKDKFRQAKMSATKLLRQVSPIQARQLIKDVMLPRKAGVGLQTAGLRMIVELNIPEPLELYKAAWSNGKCPRDVAGIILAKVNEGSSFPPEDVRSFFNFFKDMAGEQEECIYVAGLLLDRLIEANGVWSLPFLPEVVSELAMLPGLTNQAVCALENCTSHVTEVVRAMTKVLRAGRLAGRTSLKGDNPEAQVLSDLREVVASGRLRSLLQSRFANSTQLEETEPRVLIDFISEVMGHWRDLARDPKVGRGETRTLLEKLLEIWTRLLRAGGRQEWAELLASMETKLARQGKPRDLGFLAKAVAQRVHQMKLKSDEHEAMLTAAADLFERMLDKHLSHEVGERGLSDGSFKNEENERREVSNDIFLQHWANLLSNNGCAEQASTRLFSRCPENKRLELAQAIVNMSVKAHVRDFEQPGEAEKAQRLRSWELACRTLKWLSTPTEQRRHIFSSVAKLWALVAARNVGSLTFEASLQLLGPPPQLHADCALLVQELLLVKPQKVMMRQALAWLGERYPEDAARLWLSLLKEGTWLSQQPGAEEASVEAGDVQALLKLCKDHDVEPPEIPAGVARTLSADAVLSLFAGSELAWARLVAVQILCERHLDPEEEHPQLVALSEDSCEVVAVAARTLLNSLQPGKPAIRRAGSSSLAMGAGEFASGAIALPGSEDDSHSGDEDEDDSGRDGLFGDEDD